MGFYDAFFKRTPEPDPLIPELDPDVAQRLAAEGKDPRVVQAIPAEPLDIPPKPSLDGFKGLIRFTLTIDGQGKVVAVEMDGAPLHQIAGLENWAHAWRFEPARMEGKTHPCRMVFEVNW